MVVIVLGTVASASTWAFNVVRSLLSAADPRAVSLYAETAADFVKHIGAGGGAVAVKAHRLDPAFVALAPRLGAKIILTDREPLDSVVSQRERFGHTPRDAVRSISRTYAAMAALGADIPTLTLRYETKFTADPGAVRAIADFLGVTVSARQAAAIFAAHRAETLKRRVDAWAKAEFEAFDPPTASAAFDEATHWHPGHLSDGASGKGRERLSADEIAMVEQACAPWRDIPRWSEHVVSWPASMFSYPEGEAPTLKFAAEEGVRIAGPGCALPAGRWRATPTLSAAGGDLVYVRLEAFAAGRGGLASRLACVGDGDEDEASLTFAHLDHDDLLDIRVSSVADSRGALTFAGVRLRYLGPLKAGPPSDARPASRGLPAAAARRRPGR